VSQFSKSKKKNGSSGRTRTYNPPVNSLIAAECTGHKDPNWLKTLSIHLV